MTETTFGELPIGAVFVLYECAALKPYMHFTKTNIEMFNTKIGCVGSMPSHRRVWWLQI